jgi:hypothetical protein
VSVLQRLLTPLPTLCAAVLAVVLALLYLDHGWGLPVLVAGGLFVIIGGAFGIGRAIFGRKPYVGGLVMESSILLVTLGASIAGAFLVWLAIDQVPGDKATTREKEVFAAISAALTAYLGSVIIEPAGEFWNPVKKAIGRRFGSQFTDPQTPLAKDARSAVIRERYGAEAAEHEGEVVNGWDWAARRLRTRHIRDRLEAPAG